METSQLFSKLQLGVRNLGYISINCQVWIRVRIVPDFRTVGVIKLLEPCTFVHYLFESYLVTKTVSPLKQALRLSLEAVVQTAQDFPLSQGQLTTGLRICASRHIQNDIPKEGTLGTTQWVINLRQLNSKLLGLGLSLTNRRGKDGTASNGIVPRLTNVKNRSEEGRGLNGFRIVLTEVVDNHLLLIHHLRSLVTVPREAVVHASSRGLLLTHSYLSQTRLSKSVAEVAVR